MFTNSKSRLVGATLLTAAWLLTAAAIAQRSLMHHGLLENGPWFEVGAVEVSLLTIVLVGAVLFAVLRRRNWQTVESCLRASQAEDQCSQREREMVY
jgi:hypothetical protein